VPRATRICPPLVERNPFFSQISNPSTTSSPLGLEILHSQTWPVIGFFASFRVKSLYSFVSTSDLRSSYPGLFHSKSRTVSDPSRGCFLLLRGCRLHSRNFDSEISSLPPTLSISSFHFLPPLWFELSSDFQLIVYFGPDLSHVGFVSLSRGLWKCRGHCRETSDAFFSRASCRRWFLLYEKN